MLVGEHLLGIVEGDIMIDKLKLEECVIGAVVYTAESLTSIKRLPADKGKIVSAVSKHSTDGDCVIVEFDEDYIEKLPLSFLVNEKNGMIAEALLVNQKLTLEKEFEEVEKQVGDKIRMAVQLLEESNKIAKAANLQLSKLGSLVDPLEDAIRQGGWRTSSWHC